MADCSNVEIRELLPERAGGALSAGDLARVDAHLSSCELCASELALIQAARRVLRVSPAIDIARITSGVVAATATPTRPQLVASSSARATMRRAPRLRWVGWKAAAAIAITAAGVGSFAVWHSTDDPGRTPNAGVVAIAQPASPLTTPPVLTPAGPASSGSSAARPDAVASAPRPSTATTAELGVGGGLSDLSSDDLHTLLGDLGSRATAVDETFEEPDVIVPAVGTINDLESL
jgi:anti-sigma factor RsiW